MTVVRRGIAALSLVAAMVAIAPVSVAQAASSTQGNGRAVPLHAVLRHSRSMSPAAMRAASLPTTLPNVTYAGGAVVSSPQVQNVLWGSGTYIPEVDGSATPTIDTTTADLLSSEWETGLSEYDTTFAGGSGQHIGPGGVIGSAIQITPSTGSGTLQDSDLQTELTAQINAGSLPAPAVDGTGHTTTIYGLYFPSGQDVCMSVPSGTAPQCASNYFCGYHGSFTATIKSVPNTTVLYFVQPDPNSFNFVANCGDPALTQNAYDAMQGTTSHELSETITDPGVGVANQTGNGSYLGWTEASYNAEVADLCDQGGSNWAPPQTTVPFVGGSGSSFTASTVWSNSHSLCLPTSPYAPRNLRAARLLRGQVRLTWSAPTDDGRAPVQGYGIFVTQAAYPGYRFVASASGTSWTSSPLLIGHTYTFFVDAWNNVGDGTYGQDSYRAAVVPANIPAAPPWIRTLQGGTAPTVGWGAANPNGAAIGRYIVTWQGGTRTLPGSARTFHWGYLPHGRHLVTVRAVNAMGLGMPRSYVLVN